MSAVRVAIAGALVVALSAVAGGVAADDGNGSWSSSAADRQALRARATSRGPLTEGSSADRQWKADCYTKTYADTSGDVTTMDVTSYTFSLSCTTDGQWVLDLTTADSWTGDVGLQVVFDTDGNPSTGCGGFEHVVFASIEGGEVFSTLIHTPTTCQADDWQIDPAPPTLTKPAGNKVIMTFDESAIGAPRTLVWHATLSSDSGDDELPNGYEVHREQITGVGPPKTTSSTAATTSTSTPAPLSVRRLAGSDRFETAIAISQHAFGNAEAFGAVLVRADSFADALAGSVLATETFAPVLLTGRDTLDSRTEAEITRVASRGDTIWIVGGTAAIGPNVATQLSAKGFGVQRLSGADRYETAVAVAQVLPHLQRILLANGQDFADALVGASAAPQAGAVLLLTAGSTMPAATRAYIDSRPGAARTTIGGAAGAADPSATAIAGANAADTSRLVAQRFYPSARAIGLATSASFPDGLAGASHVALHGGPLLLTTTASLSPELTEYLRTVGKASGRLFVYGGASAVSEEAMNAAQSLMT